MVRSILLALAFVVSVSAFAEAQGVTLISVARRQIQGIDTISAPSPVTAEMIVIGDEELILTADIAVADRTNAAKAFFLRVFSSSDNWQTRNWLGQIDFKGDPTNDPNQIPRVNVPAASLVGKLIRMETDVPVRMSVGGTLVIGPPIQ